MTVQWKSLPRYQRMIDHSPPTLYRYGGDKPKKAYIIQHLRITRAHVVKRNKLYEERGIKTPHPYLLKDESNPVFKKARKPRSLEQFAWACASAATYTCDMTLG